MSEYQKLKEVLLPILNCPSCKSERPLSLQNGTPAFQHGHLKLHSEHLSCEECHMQFPITDDFIPIMWTPTLREIFSGVNDPTKSSLAANMEIYDAISDDYHLFTRQNEAIATRLKNAVKKIVASNHASTKDMLHLDFGCGPGHVLGWLKEFGFTQIGMDVSINNLRNARKNTGALVVCGDATCMPFATQSIDIVTESSVLHHILDWKLAVKDATRVSKKTGGIVIDSEPSQAQMAWSKLAIMVFDFRFIVYKFLSYVSKDKYIFRDTAQAKRNLMAEIHHQPGTGISAEEVHKIFMSSGFQSEIISSPTPELVSQSKPGWKGIVLNILSGRNPWNPAYGPFTGVAIGRK